MGTSPEHPSVSARTPPTGVETPVYSPWLGPIAVHQFQSALQRFDLGDFVAAEPVPVGLYGQNVFVSSTRGEFVLRGRPLQEAQFEKERFGVTLLHQRSSIPVPYPYLVDSSVDIFGWPYAFMPRLPGVRGFDRKLTVGEQAWVARASARTLLSIQGITAPGAGWYDPAADAIAAFPEGYANWFLQGTRELLEACLRQGFATSEDAAWVEQVIAETKGAVSDQTPSTLVMGDFHPDNVLVTCDDAGWRVSGLLDLGDYYFGGVEPDLVRTIGIYLDVAGHKDERLARIFGTTYLEGRPPVPGFVQRYRLTMLRDRLLIWELGKRRNLAFYFPPGFTFRQYAELYLDSYRIFAPDLR